MGWLHRPSRVGGPKAVEADVLLPPPYYLQSYPSYSWGLYLLSIVYPPFEELSRPPPGLDLASSS